MPILDFDGLLERVERLEEIERTRGDFYLFLVTTPDSEHLVISPSVESVSVFIPLQVDIQFIGMASPHYRMEQIIRIWKA